MLQSLAVRRCRGKILRCLPQTRMRRGLTRSAQQHEEPLRILFCGSEAFSITALKALRKYQKTPGSNILSIDVATRMDKPGGRGMKEMRSPQIKLAAAQLGLRIHQFDTFTGWHLPEYKDSNHPYINLVIAVSFGLLVPPRILNSAKFGGLNVHPSMLPDLRGAAPINWTILRGYTQTGVTVQTLHPSKFDHGKILSQTPQPGLAIPNPHEITAHELRLLLAPVGADMLVEAIRTRSYLQPREKTTSQLALDSIGLSLAPKILPSMKVLNPFDEAASFVLRKNRAIPKLWAEVRFSTEKGEQTKRIIFGPGLRAATMQDLPRDNTRDIVESMPVGVPFTLVQSTEDVHQCQEPLFLKVKDGSIITIPDLLVAGDRNRSAAAAAARARMFAEPSLVGNYALYRFQQHLTAPKAD